jgi:allophanate hydrolase subunit 1
MTFIDPEDDDSDRPLRPQRKRLMQIVVVVAVAALVLPSIIVTWTTQVRTANYSCSIAVAYYAPGATGTIARFSLTNPQLVGWNCYAEMFDGTEYFVAHLGIIPGAPRLVPLTGS